MFDDRTMVRRLRGEKIQKENGVNLNDDVDLDLQSRSHK